MGARSVTNAAVLDKTLRALRRAGRLDDATEPLAVLAGYSARLVDAVSAPDSVAPAYAQARAVRGHALVLAELADRIAPPRGPDDPWEAIARQLSGTT